jgi:hypothetical protein
VGVNRHRRDDTVHVQHRHTDQGAGLRSPVRLAVGLVEACVDPAVLDDEGLAGLHQA